MSRKNIISVVVIILSFVITFFFFITNDQRYSKLKFIFKYELKDEIVLEDRWIILKGNKEERAKTVVDELFLGPISVFNKKIVPFGFKYNKLYINDKTLYLDFPLEVIGYAENNMEINEMFTLIKENLFYNIKNINTIIITVNGILLGEGPALSELPQSADDNKK